MYQDKIISNIICKSQLLRHIKLVDCFCVTPAILHHLPAQLQSLEFINCPYFARNCRVTHFKDLPMLHSLELPNCIHLEISQLLPLLPRTLKALNLKGCKLAPSSSLDDLKSSFSSLVHLNVSFVQSLTL